MTPAGVIGGGAVVADARMLEAFGVGPVAEAAYLTMLRHPNAGVTELADRLGVSDQVVREALDELARLSLLRPSWEDPRQLRPVSPEIGLESLLARQEAELTRRQHQLEDGRAALAVLVADQAGRRNTNNSHPNVEELVGVDAVRDKLEQLTREARLEVMTFAPGGAHSPASLEASRPLDQHLLERGVNVRTVYLDSVRNDQVTAHYAQWLTELGGQVRTVPILPLRMIVVDRQIALVPINPEISNAGAAVLRSPGAVAAMSALFEQVWSIAAPLGEARVREEGGLTAQESAVLRLLAQGETDDVVARRLGVSVRTVRRIASELMAQLGARSRFQAGARAVERGWLHAESVRKTNAS
jgi:DNA-binding CsgD family transcriptional regulator/sugar-specific transcriptional regulator TrmB